MSFRKDFQNFLLRGNLFDLAVGVIIGAAFGNIVSAFVGDLVMPLLAPLLAVAGGDWRTAEWEPLLGIKLKYGHFLGEVIDFLIKATVIFVLLVKFVGFLKKRGDAPAPAAPVTKSCPECLETVALAAKRCKFCTSTLTALALLVLPALLAPAVAHAQPAAPKFEFGKPEEVKQPERNVQARGGLVFLGGNSQATSGTLGTIASYKEAANRIAGEATVAYVRTKARDAVDLDGNMTIDNDDELIRRSQITSQLYQAKLRYDRFFTPNNSGYLTAQALSDKPAGKLIVGGGQLGYSRQLYKSDMHRLVAEVGYDFSYEKSTAAGAQGVPIHSARAFFAEEAKLTDDTGLTIGIETLVNLNDEKAPAPLYAGAEPFEDTRVFGRAGLTTRLWENVSFGFNAHVRFDNDPAPLKAPRLSFGSGFLPRAETLDTLLEATLIVTLL